MIDAPISDASAILPRAGLTPEMEREMFLLLSRHFDGVSEEQFSRDLAEKNWVVQLRRAERLVGFSTLLATTSTLGGQPITVIYSGDTIVAPEAWGTPALARAWIAAVNRIRAQQPERRCFWLLLTSGYRTYRFLPVFWREFHPCRDAPTPASRAQLLEQLARERYGALFDPVTKCVRFPRPQRLKGRLAEVPVAKRADPHVAFFLSRNPGHAEGDELVCLTEIAETNLTAAGRRMVVEPMA